MTDGARGPAGTADVVVVGGGAIGLACAWRLAEQGVDVQVVDPDPGSGASGVAAGMLAPVTEARLGEEDLLQLGLASLHLWAGFAAAVEEAASRSIGFRTDGTLVVAVDGDDRAALRELVDRQRLMGLTVADVPARELRRHESALAPAVRRGAFAADECSVDTTALVGALLAAAEGAGVAVRRHRVARVVVEDRRARGVVLADGTEVTAGTVVLAAGSWSGGVEGVPPEARPPVRPVKGQVVILRQRPDDIAVQHTVRGYVRGSVVYMVPREDGRLICGATVEERAWDGAVTAGGTYELLRDVLTLFPGLDEAELVGPRAGFRPGTPDDLPVLGPAGTPEGLIMATGHYRNGILLAPITADAVVAWVTGTPPPETVAACAPGRFGADAVAGSR